MTDIEQDLAALREKRRRKRRRRSIMLMLIGILIALGLAAFTAFSFCYSVPVSDSSMSPTLETGQRVLVNRIGYALASPSRGDLVVYRKSDSDDSEVHIRRVIGIPGDTVLIADGMIKINGQVYQENGAYPSILNPGLASKEIKLGTNEYFLLGDNRNDSEDSRFADVGNIMKNEIIGRIWFIINPLSDLGFVG